MDKGLKIDTILRYFSETWDADFDYSDAYSFLCSQLDEMEDDLKYEEQMRKTIEDQLRG